MSLHFLPRNGQFWFYHGLTVLATIGISLAAMSLYGALGMREVMGATLWVLPYTFLTLAFRWLYRRLGWQDWSMSRLVPLVMAYGSVAGLLVAACMAMMKQPVSWSPGSVVADALQAQLFVCAWAFIYISVTGQRHIREAAMANLRLQDSLKEAQLNSLSGQLNPHFLFNSLNNLRFMIHEDARQADAMVVALSDILRYSLEGGSRAKVPLAREMEIIHRYIEVVRAQLEDRLRFSFDVPETLQHCIVPPMMLQLLVENAIKHGIENMREGGNLQLKVAQQEQQLLLQVSNDVPAAPGLRGEGTGLGLANIKRRLQLLYSGQATLQTGVSGAQFEVLIRLPLEH
jgi:hypothetical protein